MKTLTQASNRAKLNATTSAEFRRQLKAELTTAGCFAPAPLEQTVHMITIVLVYGAGYALLLTGPDIAVLVVAVAMMADVDLLEMRIAQGGQQGVEELADGHRQPALAGNGAVSGLVGDVARLHADEGEQ